MKTALMTSAVTLLAGITMTLAYVGNVRADDNPVRDRTIGFVLVNRSFAIWESPDGKTECPQGYNDGPREQFAKLYPEGSPRKFAETQLEREGEIVFPSNSPEPKLF